MTPLSLDTIRNIINMYLFLSIFFYVTNNNPKFAYHCHKFFDSMNKIMHSGLFYDSIKVIDKDDVEVKNEKKEENIKPEIKYEDKYLERMRNMDKEFHFNEEELKLYDELFPKIFKYEMERPDKEISEYEKKIDEIKNKINNLLEQDFVIENEDSEEFDSDEYKMILIKDCQNELKDFEKEKEELINKKTNINENDIKLLVEEQIKNYQIKKHLERLKNCYIIEKTPLGNVIMIYNSERETFQYYSDNTIPYRYLEPVGRKYVITFDCRPLFIDMEEELKQAEQKLKEKEEQEKMKMEELKNNLVDNKIEVQSKKSVFAKFKSYNKEAGAGKSMVPPPKNNISNKAVTDTDNKNEKILLKERANCYSHEGRFSNFNILKKVDKKVVCKKYAMSFAEFKKMQQAQTNTNT